MRDRMTLRMSGSPDRPPSKVPAECTRRQSRPSGLNRRILPRVDPHAPVSGSRPGAAATRPGSRPARAGPTSPRRGAARRPGQDARTCGPATWTTSETATLDGRGVVIAYELQPQVRALGGRSEGPLEVRDARRAARCSLLSLSLSLSLSTKESGSGPTRRRRRHDELGPGNRRLGERPRSIGGPRPSKTTPIARWAAAGAKMSRPWKLAL